ncbi:MAG: phosphoribosylanthranilate isomerase [Pseudomonadota bacterium]
MRTRVKICGVTTIETIKAAAAAGVAFIGFNHFPKSPRFVDIPTMSDLAAQTPDGICKVVLLVDPTNAQLGEITAKVPIDMIQLHGGETPARVEEVKALTGLPVMKVIGISGSDDLAKIDAFAKVADQILVDAKAPKGSDLPGGNGISFDWDLLAGRRWVVPWMLAGGLTPENVSEAVKRTSAAQVDVASGVESSPGVKDAGLMAAFVKAAG